MRVSVGVLSSTHEPALTLRPCMWHQERRLVVADLADAGLHSFFKVVYMEVLLGVSCSRWPFA